MPESPKGTESVEVHNGIEVLTQKEMKDIVYPNGSTVEDDRFMSLNSGGAFAYFDPYDVIENPMRTAYYGSESPKFFVLSKEVGVVAGIAELEQSSDNPEVYWIQHVSVDETYQGDGHGRKLLEGIFAFAQKEGVTLQGSTRTFMGNERLAHLIEELSHQTGVEYIPA